MLNIRRSRDRLIFSIESPYLGKMVFILRRGPGRFEGLMQFDIISVMQIASASVNSTIIGLDTGLSPVRRQALILIDAGLLSFI